MFEDSLPVDGMSFVLGFGTLKQVWIRMCDLEKGPRSEDVALWGGDAVQVEGLTSRPNLGSPPTHVCRQPTLIPGVPLSSILNLSLCPPSLPPCRI